MELLIAVIVLLTLTLGTTIGYNLLIPVFISGKIKEGELTKKYSFADIYNYRPTVFFSALLISLIFAWILVEYKTYFSLPKTVETIMMNVEDEPIYIAPTQILPPSPPKPQPKTIIIKVALDDEVIKKNNEPIPDIEKKPVLAEIEVDNSDVEDEVVPDRIYQSHELQQHAEFPGGGQDKLLQFIAQRYIKPGIDNRNETSGTIYVIFVIEKDGSVSGVRATRGLSPTADAEAERVLNSMPKWKPAKMAGLPVRQQFAVPIFIQ